MATTFGLSQFSQLNSLENQIDRLNNRISQFVNCSLCSESEDEENPDQHKRVSSSIDLPSPTKESFLNLNNENQHLFNQFCQVQMKLEDLLSRQSLNLNFNTHETSEVQVQLKDLSTETMQSSKELHIKALYNLHKQVLRIIDQVECGQTFRGCLKFLGVTFDFHVLGMELPEKSKLFPILVQEDLLNQSSEIVKENLDLHKRLAINDEVLKKFCFSFEDSMKSQYFDYLFTGEFKQRKPIIEKKVFDNKSWALLQSNYRKLKNSNENCEKISRTLEWQKAEVQFLKVELQAKLRETLKKEGELNFRQEELNKLQQDFLETQKTLENKQQALIADQINLENNRKKLEKTKILLKAQLEEIQKLNSQTFSQKRTSNTSKLTEPASFKKLTFNSTLNSETGDSEVEETGGQTLDNLPDISIEPIHFKFDKILPNKPSRQVPSSLTPRAGEKDRIHLAVPSTPRENSISSEKPPIYLKKPVKPLESHSNSNSNPDILSIREERLVEREAELEKREKEIQKNWLKNPTAQEFIPMIQNEMMRLKTLQREYDKKVKIMQDRINKSENFEDRFSKHFSRSPSQSMKDEQSSILSSEKSLMLNSKVDKWKDLCTLMEELLV